MSLLSAVLQEAQKTNSEDITKARNELLPKITDLTERLQVFMWGLQNYYIDVYLTSNSSRTLEQMNYKNRKYRANVDLEELQEEILKFRKEFGEKNEEINNACKNLDTVVQSFKDSCTVVDGTYILQKAARDLKSLKYLDAVVSLKNLHKKLDNMKFQGNLATALRSFRAISDTQLAVSQGQLSLEFSNLFCWNFHKSIHTLVYSLSVQQNDPVLLETVLRTLYIADQMIIDIQPFSHYFVTVLVPSIIKHNCDIFTDDHVGALVFNIKIDLNDTTRPSIPTVFNNLTAVFEFLETTMGAKLEPNRSFFECFGDCNREEFFNKLIQDCIKSNVPTCENTHQAYKEIVLELETFNKFLIGLRYVQAHKSPLKAYIEHTDLLMYNTKCKKMLAEIRDLMDEYLCKETVIVGSTLDIRDHSNPPHAQDAPDQSYLNATNRGFKYDMNTPPFFPRCAVSQNMKKIVNILTTYLEECAKLPIEYANHLVPHMKDIAEMYQGIVIKKNGERLQTQALEIALFFNNCNYLGHSLVGPPWSNVLAEAVADQLNSSLMSHIYNLRLVGIEKLSNFLKRRRETILHKVTSELYTSNGPWNLETFETFNQNVNFVLELLKETKDAWYKVLPDRMYEQSMSTVLGAVCEAMLRRTIQPAEEISEDIIGLLASRFQYAIDEIAELCADIISLKMKIMKWEKLKLIPKLFTAQLLEITHMWKDQTTLKGKFTSEEIRVIIKMRFHSNEYRLRMLKGIQ